MPVYSLKQDAGSFRKVHREYGKTSEQSTGGSSLQAKLERMKSSGKTGNSLKQRILNEF
mgnify:CR=1 FL=1